MKIITSIVVTLLIVFASIAIGYFYSSNYEQTSNSNSITSTTSTTSTNYLALTCNQLSTLINGYLNNPNFNLAGWSLVPNPIVNNLLQIYYGQGCGWLLKGGGN